MQVNKILKHHGIKGMRWGVRRYQNKDGSLTKKGKLRYLNSDGSLNDEGRKRYGENRYKINKDGSMEIQKGANLQRVVLTSGSKQNLEGQLYVSITKHDNSSYLDSYAYEGHSKVLNLTAKTTLRSPTTDDAAKLFFDIVDKNPKCYEEYQQIANTFDDLDNSNLRRNVKEIAKGGASKKGLDDYYYTANYWLVDDDYLPTTKKIFYDELKKNGYNMLKDEYDAAGGIRAPIILLDGKSSVNIKSSELVNAAMKKEAESYIEEYAKYGEKWVKEFGI